jgi:hypothetical protein
MFYMEQGIFPDPKEWLQRQMVLKPLWLLIRNKIDKEYSVYKEALEKIISKRADGPLHERKSLAWWMQFSRLY